MFGHKHMQQTSHRQQFMSEFNEGVGALRRAAGHFAQGTAERLGPTYDRARYAAGRGWESTRQSLNPVYQQMRENAAQVRDKRSSKHNQRHGRGKLRGLASLLAAGAAVGAAGAAVARRRRAQQAEWEEYDPVTGETRYMGSAYTDESGYGHRSARERVAAGAANMADNLSSRAGRLADSLHERSEMMHDRSAEGAHAAPEPPRPGGPMTGPSGSGPGTLLGPGTPTRKNQPGDPALGFPDEP